MYLMHMQKYKILHGAIKRTTLYNWYSDLDRDFQRSLWPFLNLFVGQIGNEFTNLPDQWDPLGSLLSGVEDLWWFRRRRRPYRGESYAGPAIWRPWPFACSVWLWRRWSNSSTPANVCRGEIRKRRKLVLNGYFKWWDTEYSINMNTYNIHDVNVSFDDTISYFIA